MRSAPVPPGTAGVLDGVMAVRVGMGKAASSTAPMSQALPWGREIPRWSVPEQAPPPSIAGLPASGGIVCVGPP